MAETWRSSRLVYRAMEDEDEALLAEIGADPEHFMNVAPFIPVPQGKKEAKEFRGFLNTKLLNAVGSWPVRCSRASTIKPMNSSSHL